MILVAYIGYARSVQEQHLLGEALYDVMNRADDGSGWFNARGLSIMILMLREKFFQDAQ
jgi:hypothetical protein